MSQKEKQVKVTPKPFKLGFKVVKRENIIYGRKKVKMKHTTDGHNKFYHMQIINVGNSTLTNFTVLIGFGKIGNIPNHKKHGFQEIVQAEKFVKAKVKSQLKKGYYIY